MFQRADRSARVALCLVPCTLFVLTAVSLPARAQPTPARQAISVTAEDYARAEKFLAAAANPLVVGGAVSATWLPDERFTYRNTTHDGSEFILIDPVRKSRTRAFDHEKLAAALSAAAGGTFTAWKLPFQTIELSPDGKTVTVEVETRRWSCDVKGAACLAAGEAGRGAGRPVAAGEGAAAPPRARSRRQTASAPSSSATGTSGCATSATGQEKPLTTDGVKDFGYATDNAGWKASDRAIVLWSPDSKKIATFQQDERNVGDMYLVTTAPATRCCRSWKYPLPGDNVVAMLHRVIIDADTRPDRPIPDAARLPPGDARRRLQPERHDLEPGRVEARLRLDVARPQAGGPPRGRRRHRRRAHGVRGNRGHALRVAGRLARASGPPTR